MSEVVLSATDLSVRFGGVLAVSNVSFDVRRGEVFTLIGPNGAGKTTVFNLISRIYVPTGGEIEYEGRPLSQVAPHEVAQLGIARTFQNIELFEHATVLQNLLIGRHTHRETGFWSDVFFTPKARRAEIAAREKVEQVITTASPWSPACPMACARWSSWRVRCAPSPGCCCSTSRRPASTPRKPTTWCSGSATSSRSWASRC
jgi:ABC-type branched-subunit amino acid transport system ATPase component